MRKAIPCVFLAAILLLYVILSTLRVLEQGGRSDWDEDNSAKNQIQSELLKVHQLFLSINNTLQDILPQEENMPGRSWSEEDKEKRQLESSVPLYVITPTYPRMTQLSEITRIGQVLKLARNLKWIVVEDADRHNNELASTLEHIQVPYVYLQTRMPSGQQNRLIRAKGVANRNKGLEWIIRNGDENGVFYFADDDNTYDSELFFEIRKTQRVSVFPIGFIGSNLVDSPVVKDGRVIGFQVAWSGGRTYPLDMGQFAVKVKTLMESYRSKGNVWMPHLVSFEETKFLAKMGVPPLQMEPLAKQCTQILVWHTRTSKIPKTTMTIDTKKWEGTNMVTLEKYLKNVLSTLPDDG